jgi:C4-type Zn-finger protein
MARIDSGYLPHENPCAQCGKPIAAPEWIEEDRPHRIIYLWHCWACDYRFEAVAVFDEQKSASEPLAA